MLQVALFVIALASVFIAFTLYRANVALSRSRSLSSEAPTSSTLNPVFSEAAISRQRQWVKEWRERGDCAFEALSRKEKAELEEWELSQSKSVEFHPSNELVHMLRSVAFAELARNLATRDCERMVESNIAVLRGKTIAEAKEEYDEQLSPVPYDSPILTESNWWSEPEVEEAFESCLYARRIVWSVATRREPAV